MEQFILFLIIAVVGAVFKKYSNPRNSSEDTKDKPVAPKSPLKEIIKKNIETVKTEIQSRQHEPTISSEVATIVENHTDKNLEDLRTREEMYLKKLEATKRHVASVKENKIRGIITDQDDIVKGIILSEVLGPPRAKKPYKR